MKRNREICEKCSSYEYGDFSEQVGFAMDKDNVRTFKYNEKCKCPSKGGSYILDNCREVPDYCKMKLEQTVLEGV